MLIGTLFVFAAGALAVDPPAAVAEEPIEEVVVTGEFPGPGMWKVTHPENSPGHVLWILGAQPPLPKKLKWRTRQVEAVTLSAQEILQDAGVDLKPDEKIGVFRGLSLLPAALKARKNPDEAKLSDQLPADLYQRWLVLKKKYLGSDSGVEKFRPIFAAVKLRREAVEDLGLREQGMVWDVVGKLAKKHKIKVTKPELQLSFRADDLKAKIKEFSREQLPDTECFAMTLDYIDALAHEDTQRRAHAWATADLAALESLPPLPNPDLTCVMAVMSSQVARELIPPDLREQLFALWMEAAAKALATNETTLAIVPLGRLTREGGYLDSLRARGYTIEAPK